MFWLKPWKLSNSQERVLISKTMKMGAEEVPSVSEGTRVCWKSGVKKYREQDEGCQTQSAGLMLQLGYQMSQAVCLNAWSLDSTLFLETVRSLESSAEDRWRRCLRGDRA